MKPLVVTTRGIVLTLTTNAAGHAYLCNAKTQALTEILADALGAVTALADADPRGYKE